MIRVLFDARTITDHFPGIGRYTYHLAQALWKHPDIELTLIIHPHAQDSRFLPWVENFPPDRIFSFPHSPFSPWSQAFPFLLGRRCDHFDLYHSPYYLYPYLLSLPKVVTLHDVIPMRFPHYFSPAKRWTIRTFKSLAIRRAAWVLLDSSTTAVDVQRYYHLSPNRSDVVPLAPAPQFHPYSPGDIEKVRRRYRLPERYFLYVGSNKPHKNLRTLRRAWQAVGQTGGGEPPLLVLVGPIRPPQRGEEHMRYLGLVPEADLPLLYTGAWALLFPSLYEGFGLPVLEAMACGTPVICSRIPALVETAPQGAWHLPPLDAYTWAEAVMSLWKATRVREALAAEAMAQAQKFTWERTAALTVAAYKRALAVRRGANEGDGQGGGLAPR